MKEQIKIYGSILVGALLIAIGLYFFLAPSDLAAGGVSGLSIVIKALMPVVPIGIIMFALDMFMFVIGFIALGKSFGARSLICSITISSIMTIMEWIWPNWEAISEDQLVLLLFGAFFIALGQAIVFNVEASSGGTDIIAKIITKYTALNIGTALLIADMAVVLLATGIFGLEKGLYAALGVIIVTYLIDYIIAGLNIQRYVIIVPSSEEEGKKLNSYILEKLDSQTILYTAKDGYRNREKMMITTVIERKQLVELKKTVLQEAPSTFMMIQNIHEIVDEKFKK